MKKGKYERGKSYSFGKKALVLVLAMTLLLGGVIGGTIAYLTSTTNTITNVFTTSHVKLSLTEPAGETNNYSFKMVPGQDIPKDPKVTVEAGSEACYIFVKLDKVDGKDGSGNAISFDDLLTFGVTTGTGAWTQGTGTIPSNVYYRTAVAGNSFEILTGNNVTVKSSVTEEIMGKLDQSGAELPKLEITAYGVQSAGLAVADAWVAIANPSGS